MGKKILCLILSSLVMTSIIGQTIVLNKKAIDKNRYRGITGLPYYFEKPIEANLFLVNSDNPIKTKLNLNLHEKELEVFEGNQYAVILNNEISRVEIKSNNENEELIIRWNGESFQISHFIGNTYSLNEIPRMIIDVREHRPPGEIIIKKRFVKKSNFLLTESGVTASIDLNKKSVIKVLGKEAERLAKDQKNKLKKVEDLVRLLNELDK